MTSFDDGDRHLERICKKKYKKIMPARQAKKQNPPQDSQEVTSDEPTCGESVINSQVVAEESSVAGQEIAQADLEVEQIVSQSHKEEEAEKKKKRKKHKKSHKSKHRKHNKSREGKLAVDKEINMSAFSDEDEDEEIIQEYKWSLKRTSEVIEVEDSDSDSSKPKRDMTLQELKNKYRYLDNFTIRLTREKATPPRAKEKVERKTTQKRDESTEEEALQLDTIPTAAMAQSVID